MTIKRLIVVWVMVLCLMPLGGWAEISGDDAVIEVPYSKDGVEEFMPAFALTHPNGIGWGYHTEEAYCYNVTPISVAEETDIRIFKFSDSGASYAFVDSAVYDLCEYFGGYGFLNAIPWDYDMDGQMDLLLASNWGSGISRSEISVFNRATKTSTCIYSTLYEEDPQVDLIVVRTDQPPASGLDAVSGVMLYQVRVPHPEDYNFVRLRYDVIGEYQPTLPLSFHKAEWDADAAACLLGTWYCELDEFGVTFGIAITFADDGTVIFCLIDPSNNQYEDKTAAQYRVGENSLSLESDGETVTTAFTVTDDELLLAIYGMEIMPFRKLSGEELAWFESLQPKYLPGDISQVTIDYGESEHFTHEQMDAVIAVIKDSFLDWYNCELHSIAYTSDERSASEYQYYAGSESRKTGKNYVDGIVFISSFHSAEEDEEYPGSGLNPDQEYIGWSWILLQTEEGQWELITWGY